MSQLSRRSICLLLLLVGLAQAYEPILDINLLLKHLNYARVKPEIFTKTYIDTNYLKKTDPKTNVQLEYRQKFIESVQKLVSEIEEQIKNKEIVSAAPVKLDLGLTWVAYKHAFMLASQFKEKAHVYRNGTGLAERLFEYSPVLRRYGEIIARNEIRQKTEQSIIAEFILDDDVSGRGHRFALLKPEFTKVGIAMYRESGPTKDKKIKKTYFVIVFADVYEAQTEKINCQMRQACGWLDYVRETKQDDEGCFQELKLSPQ